jgi:hypothetical protein
MQLFAEIKTFYGSRILLAEGREKRSSAQKKKRWREKKMYGLDRWKNRTEKG